MILHGTGHNKEMSQVTAHITTQGRSGVKKLQILAKYADIYHITDDIIKGCFKQI